jgi:PAS domain S-box-containing protein
MAAAIRILYVDDEPGLLDIGKLFLERAGNFEVTTAISAPEAIRLLEQQRFDAIISDYQMPEMDGIQFLVEVRNRFGQIPFILFTGRGREQVVIQAINSGADFYLQKGGDPKAQFAELSNKIMQATSRKKAEVALVESEERIRTMIEQSPLSIQMLSPDGRTVQVNGAFEKLWGITLADLKDYNMLRDEQLISLGIMHYIKKGFSGEACKIPPVQYNTHESVGVGEKRWVLSHIYPVRDPAGTIHNIVVVHQDITEQKKAEEALQESEGFNRNLIENIPDYLLIYDQQGTILYTNPLFPIEFGFAPEETIGSPIIEHVAPDHRNLIRTMMARRVSDTIIPPYEVSILKKDGSAVPVIVKGTYIKFHNRDAVLVLMNDISERKRREEELKLKDFAIESSINAIAFTDLQGNLTYVNPAFLSIMGYEDLHDVLNKSIRSFWTSTADAQILENIHKQGHWSGEITGQRKDGIPIHVQVSINLIRDASGKAVAIMGSFVDITERIRAQESLLKINQKLNVLSQLTRKDLTNQIFVLNSYLELTKNQLVGQDRIIETLQKGVQEVRLIQETIEFTKDFQDMGAKPPKWQNIKMTMLLGISHISIGNIRHSIETENLEIFADPLLEKVCQRLFENSLKHGDHVSRIRVSHTVTPEGVTIFFEDDGIGISAEQKEQIFLRSDGTRASMRSLIFVREILDITGITIRESGEPGKGARFEMTVPKGAWRIPDLK